VHRDHRPARQPPVLFLPREQIVDRDKRVGILRRARGDRDDSERRNETIDRKAVGRQSAGDEMQGRVHVGAGVLIERHFVREEPVFLIVEPLTNPHRCEQRIHGQPRRERVRQIVDGAEALRQPDRRLLGAR
jgi:hypothetical protein